MFSVEYLRQFKIGPYAIFDFVVSYLFVLLISPLLSKLFLKMGVFVPKLNWLFLVLPLSIVIHLLVGNITPMTKNFIDPYGHYMLKFIVVSTSLFWFRGVKKMK